jgi:pre-mRNA-splicing factor CDC5/CEF1
MLENEVPLIKRAMGHGELTDEVYAQVWEECYNQVLYVPSSNRFTRASVTSRKDKIECMEKKLQTNRETMMKEARAAAKLEQKLKIVLGGYQVRIF